MTADNNPPTTERRARPVFAYVVVVGMLLMAGVGVARGMQWSLKTHPCRHSDVDLRQGKICVEGGVEHELRFQIGKRVTGLDFAESHRCRRQPSGQSGHRLTTTMDDLRIDPQLARHCWHPQQLFFVLPPVPGPAAVSRQCRRE